MAALSCRAAFAQDATDESKEETAQRQAWEKGKAALEAKGEHLDPVYFIPAPVPDDKNFALAPLMKPLLDLSTDPKTGAPLKDPKTGQYLLREPNPPVSKISLYAGDATRPAVPGNWQLGRARDLKPLQEYYRAALPGMKLSGSAPEDVLAAMGRFDGMLGELRRDAHARPLCRYPLHYELGFAMPQRHLTALLNIERVLSYRASAELQLGRAEDALADIKLGLHLVDGISGESMMITGLERITNTQILLQPLWEGLAAHSWNDAQLEEIAGELAHCDFPADFNRCIRAERAVQNAGLPDALKDPAKWFAEVFALPGAPPGLDRLDGAALRTALYQNQILMNSMMQEKYLPVMDPESATVDPARAAELRKAIDALDDSPSSAVAKLTLNVFFPLVIKFTQVQAGVNQAIVACAIERYRLAQGKLPATLGALPVKVLPHDVIGGQPLHYRVLDANNYLLYSVGWNETDDGGKVAQKAVGGLDPQNGDWVWSLKPLP